MHKCALSASSNPTDYLHQGTAVIYFFRFYLFWSFNDLKKHFGIQIETVKTNPFYRAQEWFIPWEQIGEGFSGEPQAGSGIGFSFGFNDRDPGEHLPVGISSSGGTTHASNGLRWINKSDPWGSGPAYGKPPYNLREIILGPVLE